MKRRDFLQHIAYGAAAGGVLVSAGTSRAEGVDTPKTGQHDRLPYKIGIRQASLRDPETSKGMVADFNTFKVARDIPEIIGVELQVANGNPNMRDMDVVRRYKAEAYRWGLDIPSTAGIWSHGAWNPQAEQELLDSIRATEILGASVMLVAFFGKSAPDMSDKESYGPIVSLLKKVAPRAKEAGVILGLENSLSPQDNKDLVDRIDHPSVKVYYDPDNMFQFGHRDQAVPGITLLGSDRIAAFHAKNEGRILQDPWRVDWAAAFQALTEIRYDGWIVFESKHKNHDECKEMTRQNIAFIKKHFSPPTV